MLVAAGAMLYGSFHQIFNYLSFLLFLLHNLVERIYFREWSQQVLTLDQVKAEDGTVELLGMMMACFCSDLNTFNL